MWNCLLYLFQCLDLLIWFGSDLYLVSECKCSSHEGSQTPAASLDSLNPIHSHLEPENRGNRCQHETAITSSASERVKQYYIEWDHISFLSLCNIHLYINISRGIFSILPYGQQLLFLPGCHLFSCYFFDFIFKQFNTENSNTERRTDGEQIQITDFQSHPNRSFWTGVGGRTRLPGCSKQTNINKSQTLWVRRSEEGSGTPKPLFCHQGSDGAGRGWVSPSCQGLPDQVEMKSSADKALLGQVTNSTVSGWRH